ncbi:MAG TPA: GTPase Era [Vicinamibacterales bacterium]|nr:GTPase Era [Vicinamibacterales bacterium]
MRFGFVSFIGRPNAGKSTLINRLVGEKVAIVSDKPQTTRNRILAVKNAPDGQIVFLDTPGIHRPLHRMNVRMVDAALETIREVDVLGLVKDAAEAVGHGDRFVLDIVKKSKTPAVLVLNKIDLIAKPTLLPLIDTYRKEHEFADIVPVSAETGDGVDVLERAIVERLPEGEALYPQDFLTDQAERVMAAEIIREKLLRHTGDELPFTTAVVIDRFEEPDEPGALLRLFATILVERESQKPIVIGRAGGMVKRIGTEARQDLERLFDTRVFLDLRVKVNADWREDDRLLDELGVPRTNRRR